MNPARDGAREDHAEASVLFIGLNYAPEPTGISPYTAGMAEGLAELGWRSHVITTYPHYPWWRVPAELESLPRRSVVRGVLVERVPCRVPSVPSALRRALFEIGFGVRATFSRWGDPAVLVLVSPALLASRILALRARLTGVPVVTWVQDIYTLGVAEVGSGARSARVIGAIERSLLQASRLVVAIHPRFRTALQQRLQVTTPVEVVRNWSHVPDLRNGQRAAFRERQGWAPDEYVVLHAGNMGAKQGLENVVHAARVASERGSRVRFVLLGDGNRRSALESLGPDPRLTFIDPLPDSEFHDALLAADALLVNEVPGLTDMSVPSKLTTYFATGRPVIAAVGEESTTRAELHDAGAGIWVPAGRPSDLVDAAEELAGSADSGARLGESGRRYRERLLTESAAVSAFARLISGVRAERGRTRPRLPRLPLRQLLSRRGSVHGA